MLDLHHTSSARRPGPRPAFRCRSRRPSVLRTSSGSKISAFSADPEKTNTATAAISSPWRGRGSCPPLCWSLWISWTFRPRRPLMYASSTPTETDSTISSAIASRERSSAAEPARPRRRPAERRRRIDEQYRSRRPAVLLEQLRASGICFRLCACQRPQSGHGPL